MNTILKSSKNNGIWNNVNHYKKVDIYKLYELGVYFIKFVTYSD